MGSPSSSTPSLRQRIYALVSEMMQFGLTRDESLKEFDHAFLEAILRSAGGNICKAAVKAGVHRNTFPRLLPSRIIRQVREDRRWYAKQQPVLRGLRSVEPPRAHEGTRSRSAAA